MKTLWGQAEVFLAFLLFSTARKNFVMLEHRTTLSALSDFDWQINCFR